MKPAITRLLIHLIAKEATDGKSFGETVESLKNIGSVAKVARVQLDEIIAVVRTASDADPNWTDNDISQMVIDKLIEKDPTLYGRLNR